MRALFPILGALILLIANHADAAGADPLGGILGTEATAPLAEVTAPIADTAQPVADATVPAVEPLVESVEPITAPVLEAVEPITAPVLEAVEPITVPVLETVEPILEPAAPILKPVAPLLEPIQLSLDPAEPILDPIAPILDPVASIQKPAPAVDLEPIIDPATRPATSMITPIDTKADRTTPDGQTALAETADVAVDRAPSTLAAASDRSIIAAANDSVVPDPRAWPIRVISSVPASTSSIGSDGAAGSFGAMAIGLSLAILLCWTALALVDWPTPMGLQLTPPVPPG